MDQGTLQRYLNAGGEAIKAEWNSLVRIALELPTEPGENTNKALVEAATALAFVSRAGTESIKRKLLAIQHSRSCGLAPEEIMAQGQEVTVSTFNMSRRTEQLDQKVWLQWKVTGAMRELMQGEYTRICETLHFNTAEMFFEWLFAQLHNLTSEELKHSAGVPAPPAPASPAIRMDAGKGKGTPRGNTARKTAANEEQTDAGKDREGPDAPQA